MNIEDDILIEQFLRDQLSEEEKQFFLERIDTDDNFKEHFIFEKQLFESLNEDSWSTVENTNASEIEEYKTIFESEEIKALKEVIKQASNKKDKTSKVRIITLISGFAAAVLILITLNVFQNSPVDVDTIYNNNIELQKLPSFITRGGETDTLLIKAENLFKEKKYKEAITLLDEILSKEKENSNIYLYKAIAHIELNEFDTAESVLDTIIKSELIEAEKGYWYKSLLYLKSKKIKEAKEELKKTVDNTFYNHKKAKKILKEL